MVAVVARAPQLPRDPRACNDSLGKSAPRVRCERCARGPLTAPNAPRSRPLRASPRVPSSARAALPRPQARPRVPRGPTTRSRDFKKNAATRSKSRVRGPPRTSRFSNREQTGSGKGRAAKGVSRWEKCFERELFYFFGARKAPSAGRKVERSRRGWGSARSTTPPALRWFHKRAS